MPVAFAVETKDKSYTTGDYYTRRMAVSRRNFMNSGDYRSSDSDKSDQGKWVVRRKTIVSGTLVVGKKLTLSRF